MIRPPRLGREHDWKYVLRELSLIVAGILIALWLNEWGQERRERAAELQLLREMRVALAEDLEDNRADARIFEQTRAKVVRLRDHLQRGSPYTASVDTLLGALALTRTLQLNGGPYEVLRARGFEQISDDSLRARVVHLYGTTYPFIATRYDRVNEFVREWAGPYLFRNSRGITRGGGPAIPLDYAGVARDPYLASLVAWHLGELGWMVDRYGAALTEAAALLASIDRQIARLE